MFQNQYLTDPLPMGTIDWVPIECKVILTPTLGIDFPWFNVFHSIYHRQTSTKSREKWGQYTSQLTQGYYPALDRWSRWEVVVRIQPCGAAVSEQDWATESSIDLRPADELRPGHNLHVEHTVWSLLLLDSLSELSNKVNILKVSQWVSLKL